MNLAYQFVATILMLVEVNFFCDQTGLSPGKTFNQSDVRNGSHIGSPYLKDFSGSILTDNFFFGFGDGHLANFRKRGFMPTDSDESIRRRNFELSKFPSLIDENGAYQRATNWLIALEIDLPALEKKYRRRITQWRFYPDGINKEVLMLPVYQVEWRGNILRSRPTVERAVVTLTLFGTTKELVDFSVLDDSLFLRPRIQITNLVKLLDFADDKFSKLEIQEKANLVIGAAVSNLHAPEIIDLIRHSKAEPSAEKNPMKQLGDAVTEIIPSTEPRVQKPLQAPRVWNRKTNLTSPPQKTKTVLPANSAH